MIKNNRLEFSGWGGYFFLLKEMMVNIITVKAVKIFLSVLNRLALCTQLHLLSKCNALSGDEFDRLTSKVSLVNILAYHSGKCNLSELDNALKFLSIIQFEIDFFSIIKRWTVDYL